MCTGNVQLLHRRNVKVPYLRKLDKKRCGQGSDAMRRNWVSATRPDGEVVYLNLATARALSFEGKHTTVSWSEGPGGSIHVLESPIDLLTQIEGEEAAGLLLDEP
jgi:hypothetical protein